MAYDKETDMWVGYIYKIYNDVNDKVYIGQTCRTIEERWHNHKRDMYNYTYAIYKAMKKYGVEHFDIDEIEVVEAKTKNDIHKILDEREIYWVAYYNSYKDGYNETIGGQNNAPNKFPERSVIEYDMNCTLLNIYLSVTQASDATNLSASDISSCCQKKKVNRVGNRIFRYQDDPLTQEEIEWYKLRYPKIKQYDLYGNLLNIFEFVQDAVEYLQSQNVDIINGNVCSCCSGKHLSAGGFVWRKGDDVFDTYKTPEIIKKIEKRDINTGTLLETFDSFMEIYDKYHYNISAINNCCNNRIASSQGFHWCYEGMFDNSNLKRINFKSIVQYLPNGEYVKTFNSAYDAVCELRLTSLSASATILAVCNGKKNTAYGFVWRYVNDDFDKYKIKTPYKKCGINKYINGIYIETFNTAADAAESVGTTCKSYIRDCCKHKRSEYKGANWYYINDPTQPDKTKIIA